MLSFEVHYATKMAVLSKEVEPGVSTRLKITFMSHSLSIAAANMAAEETLAYRAKVTNYDTSTLSEWTKETYRED